MGYHIYYKVTSIIENTKTVNFNGLEYFYKIVTIQDPFLKRDEFFIVQSINKKEVEKYVLGYEHKGEYCM
jgi:hypothetical protein|tara:strand:- start:94 stop:303 length:210 start_codon:yes stop_codon:yes gene_type:complete